MFDLTLYVSTITSSCCMSVKYFHIATCIAQGRIQDFLKGGSESGVDIEGGANRSIVSLKQGVWGVQPPRSYGVFNFG